VRCYIGPAAANNSCHAVTLTDEYQSSLNAVDSSIFFISGSKAHENTASKKREIDEQAYEYISISNQYDYIIYIFIHRKFGSDTETQQREHKYKQDTIQNTTIESTTVVDTWYWSINKIS